MAQAPPAALDFRPGTRHRMSYEDFVRLVPDNTQAEWVDGEVIVLSNTTRHQILGLLLVKVLSTFVAVFDLGLVFQPPFPMRARPGGPGREPDVVVVLNSHRDRVKRIGMEGPADLVVELLSDETARTDQTVKLREYGDAGVPEYVVVEAREGRTGFWFYRLGTDGAYADVAPDAAGRYHSTVLPGLWFDPAWFADASLPDAEDLMLEIAPDAYATWWTAKRDQHRRPTPR